MSGPPQTGPEWEMLLERVFTQAADPSPANARLCLRFEIAQPPACVRVDGRSGVTRLDVGEAARHGSADLTFRLRGGASAHAFWRGDLHPVAALTAGQMQMEGSPLRALSLASGLKLVQAAYREATG